MKFGSTIRPELGRMDFSGIERGGRAAAEAIMRGSERLGRGIESAGASIGGAIQKYQENKMFDAKVSGGIESIMANNPAMTKYLMQQVEAKSDTGKAAQAFIEGNASKEQKALLFTTLQGVDERFRSAQPKYDVGKNLFPMEGGGYGVLVTDDQGNVRAQRVEGATQPSGGVSFQQGGTATLPGGQVVDTVFNPATGQFLYSGDGSLKPLPTTATPGTPKEDRDAKIKTLMDEYDIPRRAAASVIDGVADIIKNDITGETSIVNKATKEAIKVTYKNPETEQAVLAQVNKPDEEVSNEDNINLWEIANSQTTGIIPAIEEKAQQLIGSTIGLNPQDPEIAKQRQLFANAQQRFIRALSLNPRYPTTEQERLMREMNIRPGAFTDPQTLRARMSALDLTLSSEIDMLREAINDPNSPVDQRKIDQQSLRDIVNFKRILGVPQQQAKQEKPSDLPDDIDELWDYLSEEDKQLLGLENQ